MIAAEVEEAAVSESARAMIGEAPAAAGSWLAKVRARREQLTAGRTLDQPVPGYDDPEVVVRYRPVGVDELDEITSTIESEYDIAAEIVATSCLGVYVRTAADADLVPIAGDTAPKIDYRLRDALDLGEEDAPTVRAIAKALFADDWSLKRHSTKLLDWSTAARAGVEAVVAGE